jgi:hypothetical protein
LYPQRIIKKLDSENDVGYMRLECLRNNPYQYHEVRRGKEGVGEKSRITKKVILCEMR